jgi:hypothetical protein
MKSVTTSLIYLALVLCALAQTGGFAQTIFVPSGLVGTASTGNIGIGTSNPARMLTVQCGASDALPLRLISGSGTSNSWMEFRDPNTTADYKVLVGSQGDDLLLCSGGNEHVRVLAGGNVGIGIGNPQHKLSVNGTIRSKELIVETVGWSDDVFEPGYNLASLGEIKLHIAQHGTLPGVPSARQVAEQGISVGVMQVILLRKVEELTLHMMRQEKTIQQQQTKILQLEAELAAFRTAQD